MNPIENLWSILGHVTRDRKVKNEKELLDCLLDAWARISKKILNDLVESMPRRCQAVIDVEGKATKY